MRVRIILSCGLLAGSAVFLSAANVDYAQSNLTSDLPGVAAHLDPDLVNPWGIAAPPAGPFWVSDNGSGKSTLYTGSGSKLGLVVTIPPAAGASPPANPTGVVFNSGVGSGAFNSAPFLFDTESGTVVAWTSGTTASVVVPASAGSVYKGLGINTAGTMIYATNFGQNRIDVYDSSFHIVTAPGGFKDPNLPSGYAPFNIQNIGGNLYVTYARTNGGKDEIDGPGLGFVDVYNAQGVLQQRLVSNGPLNAPWGLALAPATGFGAFSGDLLVGNFGDGRINAFNPTTGLFAGALTDSIGNPITIDGLWGLSFGNGTGGEGIDTLYFNAGIAGPGNREDHGLFGSVNAVPEPGDIGLFACGVLVIAGRSIRRRRSQKGA
jgi:uncharacterized protein (TIGR03118 family)